MTTPNLRIWSQVDKTDPAHTKHVTQRGGFTSISAAYQIKRATETFGPIGEGWGYDAGEPIFHDTLAFVPVTIWHSGDRALRFGPTFGGAEWKDSKGRIDSDALKKATTDAVTKLLSQLGFNADVFMGLYDDNKYVAAMRAEFAEPKEEPSGPSQIEIAAIRLLADQADPEVFKEVWAKNKDGWKANFDPEAYGRVVATMKSVAEKFQRRAAAFADPFAETVGEAA